MTICRVDLRLTDILILEININLFKVKINDNKKKILGLGYPRLPGWHGTRSTRGQIPPAHQTEQKTGSQRR